MLAGLAGALVVGVVLGVLGGGGSILTIPLLVYVLGFKPVEATGYSMFIVGTAALVGASGYHRRGWLNLRVALLFVAPSVLAVYLTRHYVMPALPERFSLGLEGFTRGAGFTALAMLLIATAFSFWWTRRERRRLSATYRALVLAVPAAVAVYVTRRYALPLFPADGLGTGALSISRDLATMLLLVVVMLATGIAMLRGRDDVTVNDVPRTAGPIRLPLLRLGLQGIAVGMLTGVLGAGGGFLITPALVLLAKLPLRIAVGTSLLIVALNSLTGFVGDLHHGAHDWPLLITLTGLALGGVVLGAAVSARLPAALLRRGLGWLLTIMAVVIFVAELVR